MYTISSCDDTYERISIIRDWIIENRQYILDIVDELNNEIIKKENGERDIDPLFTEEFFDQYHKRVFDKLAEKAVYSLGCSMDEVHSTLADDVSYKDFVEGMLSVVEREHTKEVQRKASNEIRLVKRHQELKKRKRNS